MSERKISAPMSQMAEEQQSNNVKNDFVLYGYINYVYVYSDGTVSMSVDARTIKVTKTLMDSFKDKTQEEADEHALFKACINGEIPDGTVIEEGDTYDYRLKDKYHFQRIWRKNEKRVFTARQPR